METPAAPALLARAPASIHTMRCAAPPAGVGSNGGDGNVYLDGRKVGDHYRADRPRGQPAARRRSVAELRLARIDSQAYDIRHPRLVLPIHVVCADDTGMNHRAETILELRIRFD